MTHPHRMLSLIVLLVMLGADDYPGATAKEAFKAVHLVTLTAADVATLLAVADLNAAVAKAGHPEIQYG